MDQLPAAVQAALLTLTTPLLKRFGVEVDTDKIYRELGVGRTTAYEAARNLVGDMLKPRPNIKEERKKNRELKKQLNGSRFLNDVHVYKEQNPDCWKNNGRHLFTDDFKDFIVRKRKEYHLSWPEVSRLTGIPEETLKKFKRIKNKDDEPRGPLPGSLRRLIGAYLRSPSSSKKTVKDFCKNNPSLLDELKMSYQGVVIWLRRLGFTSPTGIFLQNTGLDRIERFCPHAVWGSDGKQMNIVINGQEFRWVWQCLVEYKTTVLVGGLVDGSENTDNLLKAIENSREKSGVTPMAIVIDNRLSENLPAIRSYLDEMGIRIVKTFPGNSKSNGIVEGNFSIFEKWVGGRVEISGDSAEELSLSIARMLTEVFTQLRNHRPRKGCGYMSPQEQMNNATEPSAEEREKIRTRLEEMARRFKNEQAQPCVSNKKAEAIEQVMETVSPPNPEVFSKRLKPSIYTTDLLLQALAIWKRQAEKHPEKEFDHRYYGGILRNLVDQRSVELLCTHLEDIYTEFWERVKRKEAPVVEVRDDLKRLTEEYLTAQVPAFNAIVLIQLQALYMLATKGSVETAERLRAQAYEWILQAKTHCRVKREHLLRKLIEWENNVRQFALAQFQPS